MSWRCGKRGGGLWWIERAEEKKGKSDIPTSCHIRYKHRQRGGHDGFSHDELMPK